MTPPDTGAAADSAFFGAPIRRGGWCVRLAEPADMPALLTLRARAFRDGADDGDSHDAHSLHLWVGAAAQPPRATLRVRVHADGAALLSGYAAGLYDLTALAALGGVTLELGRLCTAREAPDTGDADLLRLVWAGVARLALKSGAARLVGCTSFHTTDVAGLGGAWAYLAARAAPPADRRPGPKAPEVHPFPRPGAVDVPGAADPGAAAALPALLRAYLALGGWVSDHAVVDRDLGTCHVFTCVELDRLPPARRRAFEGLAAG